MRALVLFHDQVIPMGPETSDICPYGEGESIGRVVVIQADRTSWFRTRECEDMKERRCFMHLLQ